MIMKRLFLVFATVVSLHALAQSDETQQAAATRSKDAIDAAYSQALSAQKTAIQNKTKALPSPSIKDLRTQGRSDPLAIAKAYQEKTDAILLPKQDLLIFVSTSMPMKTLVLLGEQAEKTGAILVLRGLVGKLGTSSAVDETMKALQPVAMTGATIQIDPEQFGAYDVTVVPTFVMATREPGCANDQCVSTAFSLAGDVSLGYALETWVNRGGEAGRLATNYQAKLDGVSR